MTTRAISSQSEINEAAKEWTQCIERFKIVIDELYNICFNICREGNNFAGCREVLLYLSNATHAFESLIVMIDVEQNWEKDSLCKPQSVAWEIKATSAANKPTMQEEIWQVVQGRRRRNTLSSEDSGEDGNHIEKEKKTSVYERLAYGLRRPLRPFSPEVIDHDAFSGSNLMCPRSAMDLPQTKASMAKMAYSRERLWKGRVKPLLEEKLSSIQRRQTGLSTTNRRPTYSQVAKTSPKQKSDGDPNRSREPSLASISETAEEEDNLSTVTMAERAGLNTEKLLAELGGDDEWLAMTAEEESLAQEEESLQKEILEEERSSIDDEFEREANKQFGKTGIRYKKSWKEVIVMWTQLNDKISLSEPLCYRKPGEAAQMHEKLSSPSRRQTKTDFERRLEERQQRAFELRQRLLDDKASRLKELHAKVDEIKQKRIEVEEKKRVLLEEKMEKASEKREKNLAEVVKRGRDDDLRIQEIKLIQSLEGMSRKNEIQSKDEERQEKLRLIALKQAKKAEENAAKHAQVEENRVAKMQRDAEKLLEQTEKTEARLQNAAANRNELLEGMRKKQRKHTEKIDRLKVIENQASQNLIDRMNNKFEKAEKLYEETIGMVKQRAAELSSPRPQSSAMILSDCLLLPSEHGERGGKMAKKCTVCKVKIHSPLHALAHVCTTEHLTNRKSDKIEFNFEEIKQELETFIIPCSENNEMDLKDIIELISLPSSENNKKKRSKLKQRLVKDNETLTLVPTAAIEKSIYRVIKELEVHILAACRSSNLTESNRNQIEKYLSLFDKQLYEIRDEKDRENNLSRIIPSTTITESILKLMTFGDFYEQQNRPAKRLYLKACAFLVCLFSPSKVSEAIYKTKYLIDLAELLIQAMKLFSNDNAYSNYDQSIAILYILYQLGLSLTKDASMKSKQRLNVLAAFLISHGFMDFIKNMLTSISNHSISDKIELTPTFSIGVIETISGFINLVLRQIPDGQENQESFHQLFQNYFTIATNFLFDAIPRDSCPNSPSPLNENEGMITRNFFIALSRDIIRLTPNSKTVIFVKRVLLKNDSQNALRIVFILNSIIQKRIQAISSFEDLPSMAIRFCAYFASIDITIQRCCLLGWQHSLLLTLCRHSFDLLAPHDARYSVLIAIFSIVRKSKVAIEAMETEIGVSWLAIFLEHLLKNRIKESFETLSLIPLPILCKLQKLRKALKKNNSRDDSHESQPQNQIQPKVSPSLDALALLATTECSEKESIYNFGSLRQRLDKIDHQPKPLQKERRNKTGNKVKLEPLKTAMPETEVLERDRPPRPTPPKPIDIEETDDGDGEEESEVASISSEESEQQHLQNQRPKPVHHIRIMQNHNLQQRHLLHPQIREIPLQPQMLDPAQLIRIPSAAVLREKMAEVFAVEEIGTVPLPRLMELRRHIGAINNIDNFFEAISLSHLNHISVNIVETILHLVDDVDEVNDLVLKHVRNYLNFLFLCASRSTRFRRTFEKHSALHWLGMLRYDPIRPDVIYSLSTFINNVSVLYTDENFIHLLSDVVTNYQSFGETSDHRTYICSFIGKLLQDYPYFIFKSYTGLNRNVFNELLTIIEKIVRTKLDDDKKTPLLPSAIRFIIKFFDISIDDFREERVDWHSHVSRMIVLMDIMSFIIRNIRIYRRFFEKPAIMHNVCAIQDLLVAGDEILRCNRGMRRVDMPSNNNRNMVNRRGRNDDDEDVRIINSGEDIDKTIEGVVRSKNNSTDSDGPPNRKYARKTIEQDTIENIPASSTILYPLPSVEIMDSDSTTDFRTQESFLNLYKQRKISTFYILNLKRATMRLIGSLCVASPANKDIAADHSTVETTFKLAKAGESVKVDYVTLVKRCLAEICSDHQKNLQVLNDIEQHPSHLVSKKDVMDMIYSNSHNGSTR